MKEIAAIKNYFIENLSHEIRTPITITTGFLELIRNNAMDYSKIVKYSDLTIRNNEQIIQMLNNFLTLLKLEKKSSAQKKTLTRLDNMEVFLKETLYNFQALAEIKNVSTYYKSNIKPNQLIDYSYDDLRKIINNIISNALKYTNSGKEIYIHTFIDEKGLNVIVKDNGIGIDKEDQKRIFERFYQADNHSITCGLGIGLSLVNELVKKLKGSIQVDSKKDIGSIFTIKLPLTLENHLLYVEEKSTAYTNICSKTITESAILNNLPKLLIVDDNIAMIGYLKELLSPILNCTFAFNGKQALSFANKTQYDIILTDLKMPIMNGYQLKMALDKLNHYQTVPYIIMTASAEEYLESNKAELGINDYVIKPFGGIELITRINHHLEKNIYKKQLQSSDKESVEYNGVYAEFMKKINTIILENLNNSEFTVNDLAASCGYSHKQFTQIVQEQTGLTPVKIILEVRLKKAYELIVTDKYQSISEVLYAVGLNSRSYFNKVFVKRFGLKPGELIKKCKTHKQIS
jgi:CheY-like chemotaxis protein/AraC-like DNA-binding protein